MSVDIRAVVLRLVRSGGAGLAATLVDIGSLTGLVSIAGLSPRAANVPALVLGGVAMFFGQKYFAFRSRGAPRAEVVREMVLFSLVQLGSIVLTGFLFDRAMVVSAFAARWYVATRLVVSNVVWLGFSFPAWHVVFRARDPRAIP
jgi:putative flippase GtrA